MVLLRHVDEVEVGGEGADDEAPLVEAQRLRALQESLTVRAELARPAAVRAQGLGLGPVLLDEREAGLALLLAQDLAEHAAQRVDVAAEGVLVVIAGTGGRFHGTDCMPRIDARRACLYAGLTDSPRRDRARLRPAAPRPVRGVPRPPAAASRSGPPTTTSACSTSACATWG